MISAFFLTGSLLRRVEHGKPLRIVDQWVRTFKRLLPPAAVVLAATAVAGVWLLPGSRLPDLFRNLWASLFYFENWRLAVDATDYYADKSAASPVQHFWSLAVQGQVFIIWPLLFIIVALLVKRFIKNARVAALIVLSAVFAVSFVYSVVTTASRQDFAYFDTGARIWEFAAGGILAIVLPWIRVPRPLRVWFGVIGLAALLSCGMLLDVQGGFPGYLALWPVLSVALIIIAGTGEGEPTGVTRFLNQRPLIALGHDAYALYLVHWPILIFMLVTKHGQPLTFVEGLLVVLCSLAAARLITWLVDDRIRYAKWANVSPFRGVLVITLSMLLAAGSFGALQFSVHQRAAALKERLNAADPAQLHPGARSLVEHWTPNDALGAPPIPLANDVENDWGGFPDSCGTQFEDQTSPYGAGCSALDAEVPTLTVLAVGDSHMQQWLPALADVGRSENWQMYSFLKGACPLAIRDVDSYDDQGFGADCVGWNDSLFGIINDVQPDVVITIGSAAAPTNQKLAFDQGELESFHEGQDLALETLDDMGIPVVLLRDNPRFTFNAYECADALASGDETVGAAYGANADCGVSRGRALASVNPADELVRPGVATVDMSAYICPEDNCPAIIGNVFVYLDDNHLTATYAKTMAPMLAPLLVAAVAEAREQQQAASEDYVFPFGDDTYVEGDSWETEEEFYNEW